MDDSKKNEKAPEVGAKNDAPTMVYYIIAVSINGDEMSFITGIDKDNIKHSKNIGDAIQCDLNKAKALVNYLLLSTNQNQKTQFGIIKCSLHLKMLTKEDLMEPTNEERTPTKA